MKHTCDFIDPHCPPFRHQDKLTVKIVDSRAGPPPGEYLRPLQRFGYLPLTSSGPLPASAKLTRLMPVETIGDAVDYVAMAANQLTAELGTPHLVMESDGEKMALVAEWTSDPLWVLSIAAAKAGTIHASPAAIVQVSLRSQ